MIGPGQLSTPYTGPECRVERVKETRHAGSRVGRVETSVLSETHAETVKENKRN